MIRSPIGLRIDPNPNRSPRDQIRQAATLGAKGVVLDASGDLSPDRLSETGRRDLGHQIRSVGLVLTALNLPTRRPFDTLDQLDDRLARADRVFAMAFELGASLVLARVGGVPEESEAGRREVFTKALGELGARAEHRGIRLAIETGADAGPMLRGFLDGLGLPSLAASLDPAALLRQGHDPAGVARALGQWVAHAYVGDASAPGGRGAAPSPYGFGFPAGALDWEEYLGSLEEIDYRGFVTIWPGPGVEPASHFQAVKARLDRY